MPRAEQPVPVAVSLPVAAPQALGSPVPPPGPARPHRCPARTEKRLRDCSETELRGHRVTGDPNYKLFNFLRVTGNVSLRGS